ncbi:hypothetical protein ABQJ54_10700 [Rhodanobacter sp. Si-c]|uniref:Sel1 repeat family protein n=1 Tax=Rhodanobacter lycopersici TaxID=3162487 RepID=A0ABV3QEG9_9GAMM
MHRHCTILAWSVLMGVAITAHATAGKPVPDELRQRAANGDVAAQVALGHALLDDGKPEDRAAANDWFRKAAEQGSADGAWMFGSGYMASNPLTRKTNFATAIEWMKKSVQIDHNADHMAALAFACMIAGNAQEGMAWAQKAAGGGSPKGMQMLAMAYAFGQMGAQKDPAAARHWLLLAARKGDPESEAMLGQFYLTNLLGHVDTKAGIDWMQKAAAAGNAKAAGTLATLYLTGKMNVPKDPARAMPLARQALAANDKLGHYAMGIAYANGSGVAKDPRQAWYQLAIASRMDANHQLEGAADYMSQVATQLSPGQLQTLEAKVDAEMASRQKNTQSKAP